jgi:hypothetical protein
MDSWIINLISALGGALIALIGKEYLEWLKRPKLRAYFEEKNNKKIYISNISLQEWHSERGIKEGGKKFLRICVKNDGLSVAYNCKAKVELYNLDEKKLDGVARLGWTPSENLLHEFEEVIGSVTLIDSITLNRKDTEYLDFFHLKYFKDQPDSDYQLEQRIGIMPSRIISLQANIRYKVKVIIFSSNAKPSDFIFNIYWDGTLEGFEKAFTK